MSSIDWIIPDWPVPAGVRSASTTRRGGVSAGSYASFNLGDHVGDDPSAVSQNRARLVESLALPSAPIWLRQVHGTRVYDTKEPRPKDPPEADASFAVQPGGPVCAVLTADCLPVLLCDDQGTWVAAAHAGWRGLCAGVIEAAAATFSGSPNQLMAWLGPALGPEKFEVGAEVREAFLEQDIESAAYFNDAGPGKYFASLEGLARRRLQRIGIDRIYGGGWCTFSDAKRFFSYRRDLATGRMATLIWLENQSN